MNWIWQPDQKWIESTNIYRFMQKLGSLRAKNLLRYSHEHLEDVLERR